MVRGLLVRCKKQGRYSWQQVQAAELQDGRWWLLLVCQVRKSARLLAKLALPWPPFSVPCWQCMGNIEGFINNSGALVDHICEH